jgi:hypothetical protein
LAAELNGLRQQLVSLPRAPVVLKTDPTPLAAGSLTAAQAPDAKDVAALQRSATQLKDKRLALQTAAAANPGLQAAMEKSEALESELQAIASLPEVERGVARQGLALRLRPVRASELAGPARMQPTLSIGRAAPEAEQ